MKKIIIIAAAFIGFTTAANAQSNASSAASQTVQLSLSNALEITFTGNNSATGSTVEVTSSESGMSMGSMETATTKATTMETNMTSGSSMPIDSLTSSPTQIMNTSSLPMSPSANGSIIQTTTKRITSTATGIEEVDPTSTEDTAAAASRVNAARRIRNLGVAGLIVMAVV